MRYQDAIKDAIRVRCLASTGGLYLMALCLPDYMDPKDDFQEAELATRGLQRRPLVCPQKDWRLDIQNAVWVPISKEDGLRLTERFGIKLKDYFKGDK